MNSDPKSILISFENVVKSFSRNKVLNKLSFDIKENDFIAIIGNNGCGKTTTINILCNLLNYDEGEVIILGKKVNPKYNSYKNKLGIILSSPYIIEELTPEEYLSFVGEFQFLKKEKIKIRVRDMIGLFDLEEHKFKAIKNLSSGNRMKISLATAMIHNPSILVLDEPFINLDIGMQEQLKTILKGFKTKKTLFITSHNLDLVADLCDTFLIMDKGMIISKIHKNQQSGIEEIKEEIKTLLTKEKRKIDLEWLQ